MNARAREPSTPENIEGCDRSAMNRKVGEGGGGVQMYTHTKQMKEERGEGRKPQQFLTPLTL